MYPRPRPSTCGDAQFLRTAFTGFPDGPFVQRALTRKLGFFVFHQGGRKPPASFFLAVIRLSRARDSRPGIRTALLQLRMIWAFTLGSVFALDIRYLPEGASFRNIHSQEFSCSPRNILFPRPSSRAPLCSPA